MAIELHAAQEISDIISENNNSILLLLSGGSAFDVLEHIDTSIFGPTITISMLDERFSQESDENNFIQFQQTGFYSKVESMGTEFIETIPRTDESLEQCAGRIDSDFKHWKNENPDGVVIIVQGIGINGHTAGIQPMPNEPEDFLRLFQSDSWVVGYGSHGKLSPSERITTTITFLTQIVDHSIVYAVGEDKKLILESVSVKTETDDIHKIPARIINRMKDVVIFTDQSI